MERKKRLYGGYRTKESQRKQHQKWRVQHTEKVKQQNQRYYLRHREQVIEYYKEKSKMDYSKAKSVRTELKERVLTHYGNGKLGCVICSENQIACLSIDHINNDGSEHRKKERVGSGWRFYRWLEANNYPEGYQTLCMNCQWIKWDKERMCKGG